MKGENEMKNTLVDVNNYLFEAIERLNDDSLSSDGENLTNIPFDETKEYREKVSNAYSMYLKLYEGAQI